MELMFLDWVLGMGDGGPASYFSCHGIALQSRILPRQSFLFDSRSRLFDFLFWVLDLWGQTKGKGPYFVREENGPPFFLELDGFVSVVPQYAF